MVRLIRLLVGIVFAVGTITGAMAGEDSHAGRSVNETAKASGHASASAAHSIAASGQVTSAVSAIPLSVGGAVLGSAGAVSTGAARDSMNAAASPIGTPLEVTNETITVIPPNEALKPKDAGTKP